MRISSMVIILTIKQTFSDMSHCGSETLPIITHQICFVIPPTTKLYKNSYFIKIEAIKLTAPIDDSVRHTKEWIHSILRLSKIVQCLPMSKLSRTATPMLLPQLVLCQHRGRGWGRVVELTSLFDHLQRMSGRYTIRRVYGYWACSVDLALPDRVNTAYCLCIYR